MEEYLSLGSDAAASCIVTTNPSYLKIRDMEYSNFPQFSTYKFPEEAAQWALDSCEKRYDSLEDVLRRNGITVNDIDIFSFDNINEMLMEVQMDQYGIDESRVFVDNIRKIGHTYSADNLINIYDVINLSDIENGSKLIVQNSSHMMWGTFLLEFCVIE